MKKNILHNIKHVEWIFLLAFVVMGILLRIIAQANLVVISPDGMQYINHAYLVSKGVGFFERRGPLFQLLFIIYLVLIFNPRFFPLFFGRRLRIIFFFVGKHFFDSKTGLMAAILSFINLMSINLSSLVLRETFTLFLILTFILTAHYTLKLNSQKKVFFTFH